jgi:hypothetical protein
VYTPSGWELRVTHRLQPDDLRRGLHRQAAHVISCLVGVNKEARTDLHNHIQDHRDRRRQQPRQGLDQGDCRDLHLEVPQHHHLYRGRSNTAEMGER